MLAISQAESLHPQASHQLVLLPQAPSDHHSIARSSLLMLVEFAALNYIKDKNVMQPQKGDHSKRVRAQAEKGPLSATNSKARKGSHP